MSTVKANDLMKVDGGIPTVKGQQLIPTAWVNFNGTSTVAIRDSENVSSITDNAVGKYTVNFTTNMSNINYGYAAGGWSDRVIGLQPGVELTTSAIAINSYNTATAYSDSGFIGLVIMGGQS